MNHKCSWAVAIVAVSVLVTGCQATSPYAGSGPLSLSRSAAAGFEKYLKSNGPAAFAIQTRGSGYYFSSCPYSRCAYPDGFNAEEQAIKRCEKSGGTCKVLAVRSEVVWNGEVKMPVSLDGRKELRIERLVDGNLTQNYRGEATISAGSRFADLRIRISNKECPGKADLQENIWSIKCLGEDEISGTIGPSKESLYWGQSQL